MTVGKQQEYKTITLLIEKGKLNLSSCDSRDREVLQNKAVIYIYHCETHIYVGQTNQFITRHGGHLKETKFDYKAFDKVIVLFGKYVDQNSQDDLENLLITYLTADNDKQAVHKRRTILNRTTGNYVVDYATRKDVHSKVLVPFWENELMVQEVACTTNLGELRRSILFKYSPFTTLSSQQLDFINQVLAGNSNYLITGGAGTGKTVILTNLVARLSENHNRKLKIGVVVKSNWKKSAQKIFEAYSIGENVVVGSAYQIIKGKNKFDVIVVDEAHRLRWGYSKQFRINCDIFDKSAPLKNELFQLGNLTKRLVLLYDNLQTIRPSDISGTDFDQYIAEHDFQVLELTRQFRIQLREDTKYTGDDYINGIKNFLQLDHQEYNKKAFQDTAPDAYFGMVNSIRELFDYLNDCRHYQPTSQNRVIAGYARRWVSKKVIGGKKRTQYDWIEDNENKWYWNATNENWIARKGSEEEIGSIHAIQGVDLDYAGLIVARDLSFREGKVVAVKENYFDEYGIPLVKDCNSDELDAFIKNIYYTLFTRGISGIRIYIEDDALRNHFMREVGLV